MKISRDWLEEYIHISDKSDKFISDTLTNLGLEVGSREDFSMLNKELVIGQVVTCIKHPNSEKLKLTTVDIGKEVSLQIVCGAPNVKVGQKVVVAPINTILDLYNGEQLKLKKSKIRGEISEGMICAEDEIGISSNHDTIIELDTDLKPGTPVSQFYNTKETTILHIDLTPNRSDAISHIGVARDLAAKLDQKLYYPAIKFEDNQTEISKIKINILDPTLCPRFAGVVIENINVKESSLYIKNRLKSVSVNSINNIVDITNFVLHETGQPLHAYDLDKIEGNVLNIKTLGKKFKFITLDKKERELDGEELMICDAKKPLCIAGIMGGINSGVTEETTKIFLECAYFNPTSISKAVKRLGITSDSSYRFERGTDPNNVIYALKRAIDMILKESNAKVASKIVDIYPNIIEKQIIEVYYDNINKLIGIDIAANKVKKILTALEINIEEENAEKLIVSVPTYRTDVVREVDIIEEILRHYGFNEITFDDKIGSSYLAEENTIDKNNDKKEKISDLLVSKGYNEIMTNSLIDSDYATSPHGMINILNPLSKVTNSLRQTMIPSHLEVLSHNLNRGNTDCNFFEFGKIYWKERDSYLEKNMLNIMQIQNSKRTLYGHTKETLFQSLNSILHIIISKLGIDNIKYEVRKEYPLYERCIILSHYDNIIGVIGYLCREVLNKFKISEKVVNLELFWENILKIKIEKIEFKGISKFPQVSRDLSIILNDDISYKEVKELIEKDKDRRLINFELIDIYKDKKNHNDKKTFTLNFTLQDHNKTLKDKGIDKIMSKLMVLFQNELKAEIKGI